MLGPDATGNPAERQRGARRWGRGAPPGLPCSPWTALAMLRLGGRPLAASLAAGAGAPACRALASLRLTHSASGGPLHAAAACRARAAAPRAPPPPALAAHPRPQTLPLPRFAQAPLPMAASGSTRRRWQRRRLRSGRWDSATHTKRMPATRPCPGRRRLPQASTPAPAGTATHWRPPGRRASTAGRRQAPAAARRARRHQQVGVGRPELADPGAWPMPALLVAHILPPGAVCHAIWLALVWPLQPLCCRAPCAPQEGAPCRPGRKLTYCGRPRRRGLLAPSCSKRQRRSPLSKVGAN